MGVMYGKVRDHTFWIMDAAALPVQGTETRVNAGNEVSLASQASFVSNNLRRLNTWSRFRNPLRHQAKRKC